MANKKQKWQEIANRGLQGNFDPQTRAKFDEAVNRGLITVKPSAGVSNDIPSSNLGVPSDSGLSGEQVQPVATQPQEKSFLDKAGEFFTGSDRETRATRELPEIGSAGLLSTESPDSVFAITPALLTATDPNEIAKILQSNFPSIGIQYDEKGNIIAGNNKTGVRVVLNKPGVSQFDVLQGLGLASAFTPSGRIVTGGKLLATARLAGATGATSAGVEALQALSGGEFDASQVAIDTVTAGVLDKAFEVAKATGRGIKDVLRKDANIDPEKLLKSFEPQGFRTSYAKAEAQPAQVAKTLQKATQADLPQEAIPRLRQAEEIGVDLTSAQASKNFGSSDAEQTLLKSVSTEGDQARAFAQKQQDQLKQASEDFVGKFGGSARFTEAGGELADVTARDKGAQIQASLQDAQDFTRKEVSELYTLAAETAGEELPLNNAALVDIADEAIVNLPISDATEKTLNTALAKFGLIGDSVEQASRNKFNVIDGTDKITITGDVTPLTLKNAEQFRQALNKAVSDDRTGSAKGVIVELDKQIEGIIEQGAESGRSTAFKTARESFSDQRAKFSAKDIVQDLVGFKKGTKTAVVDPETVITKIAKGEKSVTNIRKVKKILLENPTEQTRRAWKSIQAETVGDILSQAINKDTLEMSGARLNSAMKKYRPEALIELLGKKKFAELKRLQETMGDATIPPPGTTNPSGTFTKLLSMAERLGNVAGAGQFNFGSLAVGAAKKGKELKNRKATLDGIVNTKIKTVKASNPKMNRNQIEKAARALAFLEIRDLDKESNQ